MSDIAPISRSSAPSPGGSGRIGFASPAPVAATRSDDTVEFSQAAQLLSKLSELPDVRSELVARVKKEIAEGSYVTPEKIDAAIDNLAEDLL